MSMFLLWQIVRPFSLSIALCGLLPAHTVLAEFCSNIAGDQSKAKETVKAFQKGGLTIVMRHLDKTPPDKSGEECLTRDGHSRAAKIGENIRDLLPGSKSWTILYSGKCRTRETAQEIATMLGVAPKKDDNLLPHTGLRDGWFASYARDVASKATIGGNHLLVTHSQKLDLLNKELRISLHAQPVSDENYGVAYVLSGREEKHPLLGCIWLEGWATLNNSHVLNRSHC